MVANKQLPSLHTSSLSLISNSVCWDPAFGFIVMIMNVWDNNNKYMTIKDNLHIVAI